MSVPVSVIIPVKNEAKNLPACLASVAFADEVWVVDSGSTDGTGAIAEAHGARVVQFVYNGGFPKKKNWALTHLPLRHEWVLLLDADERVPPALAEEIAAVLAAPGVIDAMCWLEPGMVLRPVQVDGDRKGFAIATGVTVEEATARADAALDRLVVRVAP